MPPEIALVSVEKRIVKTAKSDFGMYAAGCCKYVGEKQCCWVGGEGNILDEISEKIHSNFTYVWLYNSI